MAKVHKSQESLLLLSGIMRKAVYHTLSIYLVSIQYLKRAQQILLGRNNPIFGPTKIL